MEIIEGNFARDAARSPITVILSRLQIALFLALIGVCAAPLRGAAQTSVSGVVRDSEGVPQIGAVVQLLRPNESVVALTYTNSAGHFAFPTVVPGRYALKATGSLFLPSLRENVRVHANTVVNLTLNTLYEVMQWLPAEPRAKTAQNDDWAWTLRSAANRPLLRWLEDGPLVVVSEGPHASPKLKARLMATGQEGSFGEDGQRVSFELEETPVNSRELLARVEFDPNTDEGLESMLGFRQDLGFAGSVQSVAAVAISPEIGSGASQGLDEATMRSWESMNMGDEFEAEAGAEQVLARFAQGSPNTVLAALPFMTLGWRNGDSTVSYRMATAVPGVRSGDESQVGSYLPALSMRQGNLVLQRGMHQEIGWDRTTDASSVSVLVYSDSLSNPVLEAAGPSAVAGNAMGGSALADRTGGLLRIAGPGYSAAGVVATAERRLPRGTHLRASYATGQALAMTAQPHSMTASQVLAAAHPRNAQMYSISLSGILDGTGTRWRASYRWQPENTVTRVAAYARNADDPFLNVHLRQPLCGHREGVRQLDAMIDLSNLLAQGYRPFVLTDGSLLMFAQDQRSVSAGVAFTF